MNGPHSSADGKSLEFFVPGRPLPKQSARFGKGRAWQPKAKVEYKRMVEIVCRNAWLRAGKPAIKAPFIVQMSFVFGWPKSTPKSKRDSVAWRTSKPDLDNLCKMVLDAMTTVIPEDADVATLILMKTNGPRSEEGVTVMIGTCCEK